MSNVIILYSTGCPKCNILKKKLDDASIEYTVESNIDNMMELGILSVPVLKVNDKLLSYMDAIKYVNEGRI